MRKVVAFMNAYTQGKSGGDVAFVEIFKRVKNSNIFVITSKLGAKFCQETGLQANYLLTTKEKEFKNIIVTYMKRVIKACFLPIKISQNDLLYATSDALPDTLPVFLLKTGERKVKWVQKVFHLVPEDRYLSYISQRLSLFLIKKFADVIIVDNNGLKTDLISMDFPQDRVFVNHLGIDFEYFNKIRPGKISYDATFMARLHPSKGLFDLIKIWSKVVKKLPKAKLAIIGTGDEKTISELKTEVVNINLQNNIFFLGYLNNDQAFSLIKASKLFIFPSHEEGFGLIIAEVLSCGLPVVAYDLPAYKDIFHDSIQTIPMFNINQFSKISLKILIDKKKQKISTKKRQWLVKNFTWDKTASFENLLLLK